jgi:hypothetical protein
VIIPYQRDENSGSQTVFPTIMRGGEAVRPIVEGQGRRSSGMSYMLEMAASNYYNYNSALGYTFLFYLNRMAGSINGLVQQPGWLLNKSCRFGGFQRKLFNN